MQSKIMARALSLLLVLALTLGMGTAWAAAAEPSPQGLDLARRLVRLKPLDYKTISQIMEIDCLQSMAGNEMGKRLDLKETKNYCQVVGNVFWSQVKDQVYEAMAQSYAHYLTQRELEVIIEGLLAERRGRASKYPPQETKAVVAQLRRVDPASRPRPPGRSNRSCAAGRNASHWTPTLKSSFANRSWRSCPGRSAAK